MVLGKLADNWKKSPQISKFIVINDVKYEPVEKFCLENASKQKF
jgi:hypothetical protein